jgi:hypothetical protein
MNQGRKKTDLLYCKIKNLKATGRQTDSGFVVLKGSEAVLDERPSTQNINMLPI